MLFAKIIKSSYKEIKLKDPRIKEIKPRFQSLALFWSEKAYAKAKKEKKKNYQNHNQEKRGERSILATGVKILESDEPKQKKNKK